MRTIRSKLNKMCVSAQTAEPAFNTYTVPDTTYTVSSSDLFNIQPRRETNTNEANGKEEPDQVYYLGQTGKASMNLDKAMPQHFGFILAYALGLCTSTKIGTKAYQHDIRPLLSDVDIQRSNPTFTASQRYAEVARRRFDSCAVDTVTVSFEKDSFAKLKAELLASGSVKDNLETVEVVAAPDAISLTLPLYAVDGSTDAERLSSIHLIQCELAPGVWYDVTAIGVSAGLDAVVSLIPLVQDAGGGKNNVYVDGVYEPCVYESSTEKNYRVLFAPRNDAQLDTIQSTQDATILAVSESIAGDDMTEQLTNILAIKAFDGTDVTPTAVNGKEITIPPYDSNVSDACEYKVYFVKAVNWQVEPDKLIESALRVSGLRLTVGGYWSDDDQKHYGGRVMRCELNSIEWQFKNNLKYEFCAGTAGDYANRCWRDGREQTLSIDRELRDFIYQKGLEKEESFALSMEAVGMSIEDGIDYKLDIIFPSVTLLDSQISDSDKRDTEKMELQVLQKDNAPSVAVTVVNCVPAYCQL